MKKIIVTPGITDLNRGDQSLVWLIDEILKENGVETDTKLIFSGFKGTERERQSKQSIEKGYKLICPILDHPGRILSNSKISYSKIHKIFVSIVALSDLIKSAMLLSKFKILNGLGKKLLTTEKKGTYSEFNSVSMVIVKGGGFIHTYNRVTDLYYLYYTLYDIMLAKRFGKIVIIMPNSFGPVRGKLEKKIVKKILSKCDIIFARESISNKYLRDEMGIGSIIMPDLGFYISDYLNQKDGNRSYDFPKNKELVAITMRPYRFPENKNNSKLYDNYIKEMYFTARNLIEKGYHVVFTAHTLGPSTHEDDRIALNQVIGMLKDTDIASDAYTYIEDFEMDCYRMARLYSNMHYIIGTRFHSVIFAMTCLVPALAISYSGNKTTGIMNDMGLGEYVIDMDKVSRDKLIEKFEKLVSNKNTIKDKQKQYLEKCENKKKQLTELIIDMF